MCFFLRGRCFAFAVTTIGAANIPHIRVGNDDDFSMIFTKVEMHDEETTRILLQF